MTTALAVCAEAYRQLNLDQALTSFSTTQAYPYNIALDLLNKVIRELNRLGKHAHMELSQYINANGRGSFSIYEFAPVLNPRRIIKIRLEPSTGTRSELAQLPLNEFQASYPEYATTTGRPVAWTFYNANIVTNCVADADYGTVFYFQQEIPQPTSETEVLAWPDTDIDILTDGVIAYLSVRLKLEDAQGLLSLWQRNVNKYLAYQFKGRGLPLRMPARF